MNHRKITSIASLVLFIAAGLPGAIRADTIAVIGTGDVAGALGPEFAGLGHTIVYGSRNPDRDEVRELVARTGPDAAATTPAEAASGADIVVLAVPGSVVEAVTEGLGDLAGKIIVDPTNALRRRDDGFFEMEVGTSNAELIQAAAPDAFVVKAFNTLNWRQMVDPASSGGPISIPLVGDSAAAKSKVATLVTAMGLEPIDLGPVRYAHVVEGMLVLWVNSRFVNNQAFEFHLRKVEYK